MADFFVFDKTPNYNVILGRRTLNEISAVSTCHLVMRFPTPHGIREVGGSQSEARSCHFVAMKGVRCAKVFTSETEQPSDLTTIEKLEIDTLDPRDKEKELRGEPIEDLED